MACGARLHLAPAPQSGRCNYDFSCSRYHTVIAKCLSSHVGSTLVACRCGRPMPLHDTVSRNPLASRKNWTSSLRAGCGTAQHGLKRRGTAEKGFNIQHARGWSITVMARERTGVCTQHLPFPLCVCPVCVKRGQIRMLFLSTQSLCCCCHGSDSKVTKLVIGCSFRKQDPSLCPQKRHPPYYFCNACAH